MKTMMIHISKSLTLTTTTISSGFNYFFYKDVHNVRALAEKKLKIWHDEAKTSVKQIVLTLWKIGCPFLGDCLLSDRASLKLMNIDSQIRLQLVRNMGAVGQNLRSGETTHEIEIQPSTST